MMDKLFAFSLSLVAVTVYSYFANLYATGHMVQDAATAATIGGILNTTSGWAGLGVGYFLASSAGSAAKDKTISEQIKGTGNGTTSTTTTIEAPPVTVATTKTVPNETEAAAKV